MQVQSPGIRVKVLNRFDLAIGVVSLALLVMIGLTIARGDQLGIVIQNYGPIETGSSRTTIRITFEEPVEQGSIEKNFSVDPPVDGKFSVSQNLVVFSPSKPLTQGQDYTVVVKAGVQATTGRTLKQTVQWRFRVSPPRIVYLGPVDSIVQNLYLIDPSVSGGEARKLTDSKDGVLSFDVAADGSSIVYEQAESQGPASLYLFDVTTGTSRLLYDCKDAICSAPSWRPDGGAIAFERTDLNSGTGMAAGAPRIWVLDLATDTARPLFSDSQKLGYAARWSPDSQRLAVYSVSAGGIVVHDFAGGKDSPIETVQGEVGEFSPDSKWLFFPKILQLPDKRFVTHVVLVDISSAPPVTHDLVPDDDPSDDVGAMWLPDSKSLIVLRRPTGPDGVSRAQLYRVEISTGKATPLTDDQSYGQSNLSLNPTGDTIVFQRFPLGKPGARPEIWTFYLTTGDLRRIVVNGTLPNWLP
jgi:Tol biopolymer transport system component